MNCCCNSRYKKFEVPLKNGQNLNNFQLYSCEGTTISNILIHHFNEESSCLEGWIEMGEETCIKLGTPFKVFEFDTTT